ncbi:MAG TPA: phosphoribosylglycinamide formyltransferase [Candidatus Borkfalkia avicola]|uniref:Phosphoribosylglycinamide formyltransferase n=1 Tax=Candidatus Borkfalkia avicola TaxID=2838503 RepID=A0A9D2IHT0_9FIRM|nr:phosphoribosylglycinamide formyltransferase [Candidatus Borkfalkia avicola]
MKRIAVFASGSGSDFQSVIDANEREPFCEISLLVASKAGIGAVDRAEKHGIAHIVCSKKDFSSAEEMGERLIAECRARGIDYIVLAGYLSMVPENLIRAYPDAIINIHPSLIPAFCGKGFYGLNVHRAAVGYGVKISGLTVHFVDEQYDSGAIILQRAVPVADDDTPESLQARILEEEHRALPEAVRLLTTGRLKKEGRKVTVLK